MYGRHENTGAVLQAYMRRSIEDVQNIIQAGFSVRLCKGIYDEPRAIAYKDFDTVRQNYIFLLDELLEGRRLRGHSHARRVPDLARPQADPPARDPRRPLRVPDAAWAWTRNCGASSSGSGHKLRVYVPFGEDWYEYSTRRLKENPKIAGYVAKDVIGGA